MLGKPENLRNRAKGNAVSIEVRRAKAEARLAHLEPVIRDMRAAGKASLSDLARALNEREIPAPRGGQWSAVQVQRVVSRLGP